MVGLAYAKLFPGARHHANTRADHDTGHQRRAQGADQLRLLAAEVRRFAGMLGRTLTLDNPNDARTTRQHTYTIVGVMPAGVPGPDRPLGPHLFEPGEATLRDGRYLDVYGRLKPGVSVEAAERDLQTIAGRLAVAYPKTNQNWSVAVTPLIDQLVGPVRPALVMLFAAAACVLLIGAANLANLFLVRCLAREKWLCAPHSARPAAASCAVSWSRPRC